MSVTLLEQSYLYLVSFHMVDDCRYKQREGIARATLLCYDLMVFLKHSSARAIMELGRKVYICN